MQHYGLNGLYHAVERYFPKDSDDPQDFSVPSQRPFLEISAGLRDPNGLDNHYTLSLATDVKLDGKARSLILTFPERDWYQTIHGRAHNPDLFPETLGSFRRWWDELRTAQQSPLDLTFAATVPLNALLYDPTTYHDPVGHVPTPSPVREEFERTAERRPRHQPYNPNVLPLRYPNTNDHLASPADRLSLYFDNTSYGAGFVGRVADTNHYLYVPVTSSLQVVFTQHKLLLTMSVMDDLQIPPLICPGSFERSFPDLSKATRELDALPLVDAEKSLIDEASRGGDTFEAMGVKFPAEQITGWGVVLIVGLQLYLFTYMRRLVSRLGPQADAWDAPWIGLDDSKTARLILFVSTVALPLTAVAVLAELAISQALLNELHEERLALASIFRESCPPAVTRQTVLATMKSPTVCYLGGLLFSSVLCVACWACRPKS
jgi:hypothetical protein